MSKVYKNLELPEDFAEILQGFKGEVWFALQILERDNLGGTRVLLVWVQIHSNYPSISTRLNCPFIHIF